MVALRFHHVCWYCEKLRPTQFQLWSCCGDNQLKNLNVTTCWNPNHGRGSFFKTLVGTNEWFYCTSLKLGKSTSLVQHTCFLQIIDCCNMVSRTPLAVYKYKLDTQFTFPLTLTWERKKKKVKCIELLP